MQTKVEVLEGLLRKLTVEVPSEEVQAKIASELARVQKKVKIDGFRPGKVPAHVVQQRYGEAIMRDAVDEAIQGSYEGALRAENIEPAGSPLSVQVTSDLSKNENLVYEVQLEVMPEFEVQGLDSLTVKKPIASVEDKDVEEMINTLRKQAGEWVSSDDKKTEAGHRALLTFKGKLDGEAFDGGAAEKMPVEVGAGQMLPDFEEAIVGREKGEEFTADVSFPEDYQAANLAGKTAQFEFKIEDIETLVLPEVNEELVKKFGVEDGSVEAFTSSIRENLERQLRQAMRTDVHRQVKQHLLDSNKVVVPEVMVNNEKQHMAQQDKVDEFVKDAEQRKAIVEQYDQPARRRVTLGLIMGELFKQFDVKLDSARVDTFIDDLAATYENPEEFREFFKSNPQHMQDAQMNVLEDQLIDELVAKAKVEEVEKGFQEMMKSIQG